RDAAGNPIPGATVTYTAVPASGASCTVSNGASSGASVSATTDSSGLSSVTATANSTVGAFTVTASVSGVGTPATFHLQNVSTGPAAVFIVSGNPQTTPTGAAFASRLVVVVGDAERRLRLRPGRGGVHDGDDECVRDRERQRDGQLDLGTIRGRRVNAQRPDGGELRSHERVHRGLPVHGHHSHLRLVDSFVHRVRDERAMQQQE